MRAALFLLAAACAGLSFGADAARTVPAPSYSASSIVNSASGQAGALAPNTIISIYGSDLAYVTRAVSGEDIQGTKLPTLLGGTGVSVLIGKIPACIYFISPAQINVLVPSSLIPGPVDVQVGLNSRYGQAIQVNLDSAAPALFQLDSQFAIATRADGSVITKDTPVQPGDFVVLYATGLGPVVPAVFEGQLPTSAARIAKFADFQVQLDGQTVDRPLVFYAGVTPGFAGLFQVNLKLPDSVGDNPEIRIGFDGQMSPPNLHLSLKNP